MAPGTLREGCSRAREPIDDMVMYLHCMLADASPGNVALYRQLRPIRSETRSGAIVCKFWWCDLTHLYLSPCGCL